MTHFSLEGQPYIQLNDLLKVTGLCHSGGLAKKMISDGLATVDGNIELRKRCKIKQGQVVEFQGETIKIEE